jgi:hypothetical protein
MLDEVADAVAALIDVLQDGEYASATALTVDITQGTEHPFRIVLPEEQYPVPGIASTA